MAQNPHDPDRWPLLERFIGRMKYVLTLLAAIMALGVFGFRVLQGSDPLTGLYYTVMILTTLGLPDVPADARTKAFIILLALCGIVLFLYAITVAAQFMMDGEFERCVRRGKVIRRMKHLTSHYIICGYGRMGEKVALQMRERGLPFLVVENNDAAFAQAEAADLIAIRGDATQEETLREAGLDRAHALISVASTDAENVLVTMTARQLNARLPIIARCAAESNADRMRRAGATRVVTPYSTGAYQLMLAATKPHVIDWFSLATGSVEDGFEIEEVPVPDCSAGIGQSLRDLALSSKYGVMIIGIKSSAGGAMRFNPSADTRLAAGDLLICVGKGDKLNELEQSLSVAPPN